MPKRRLGYGEIVLENDSQASSRRRRGSNGGTENPKRPTTRRSSEILLGLSHSCKKHAEYHKDRKNITLHEEENHLPARCKSDLQALRNLLPKVEKTFQPPTKGKVGPAASDVALLCEFYGSILGGTFCPHAPHLFHLGKSTTEGRIIYSIGLEVFCLSLARISPHTHETPTDSFLQFLIE